jgi:hypothetical protein
MSLVLAVLITIAFLLSLFPLWMAVRCRCLVGQVLDESGDPLVLARVELRNLRTWAVLRCVTDGRGRFHFDNLGRKDDFEIAVVHQDRRSLPLAVWSKASIFEVQLQFEPVPSRKMRYMVLEEAITEIQWFSAY